MIPARARFESFAGCHADREPPPGIDPIDWLQVRLAAWEARQPFHVASALPVAAGCSEEAGELADADDLEDQIDAVGDGAIFAAQVASRNRLAMSLLIAASEDATPRHLDPWRELCSAQGALIHLALKRDQGIRDGALPAEEYRAKLARAIVRYIAALDRKSDVAGSFTATAAKILARDWRADPVGGGQ